MFSFEPVARNPNLPALIPNIGTQNFRLMLRSQNGAVTLFLSLWQALVQALM
jgi:hypothetical protein